jgi:agmatine deiminase
LDVIDFTPLAHGEVAGHRVVHSYLNLYLCNGAAVVLLAGPINEASDQDALDLLTQVFATREIIGVPGLVMAFGGGGPHCITQQVPARPAPA